MQEKKSQRSDLIYYMLYVTSITSSTAYKCPKCIQGEILLYIYIFFFNNKKNNVTFGGKKDKRYFVLRSKIIYTIL